MSFLSPHLKTGIGLRHPHHQQIIAEQPSLGWLEIHSENLFSGAPILRQQIKEISKTYPLSFHGVGLSLGSADGIKKPHLARLKQLVEEFRPALVSDHLSWSGINKTFVPDLLPLPLTHEALNIISQNISQVQTALGRQILIENPSGYLEFTAQDYDEPEFLAELVKQTNCGLILDINNIAVSAHNLGWSAPNYLKKLAGLVPAGTVQEIHLAGYHINTLEDGQEMWIDTHSKPVYPAVWGLYKTALQLLGDTNTLIEWDLEIPPLKTLLAEAQKADKIRQEVRHATAA